MKRPLLSLCLTFAITLPIGAVAFVDFKSCLSIDRWDETTTSPDLHASVSNQDVLNKAHAVQIRAQLISYKREYTCRFKRNQYAQNAIIAISILLSSLIVVTGSSPWFKDPKHQSMSNPLGISAAAWLGLIATALLSLQKSYNISSKVAFYPTYILKVTELINRLDNLPFQKHKPQQEVSELNAIQRDFFNVRQDEIKDRPTEVAPKSSQ